MDALGFASSAYLSTLWESIWEAQKPNEYRTINPGLLHLRKAKALIATVRSSRTVLLRPSKGYLKKQLLKYIEQLITKSNKLFTEHLTN